VRVVIGEDEMLLREGLSLVLGGAGIEIAGSAGDATTLLDVVERTRPDVVITDIRMPPRRADDGLVAATRIRLVWPDTGVLVLSQFVQRKAMMTSAARSRRDLDLLTPRQREVLELVAQGRSNAAIATRLEIAEKSVVQHVSRIYDELGLEANSDDHRRVLAVVRYLTR